MADYSSFEYTDGDIDTNQTSNPDLETIIRERYSRRGILKSSAGVAAVAASGALLAACGNDSAAPAAATAGAAVSTTNSAITAGRIASLSGTATGASSTFWSQLSGPPVTIVNPTSATPTFLAPAVASATPLSFSLGASAANGVFSSSTATVTVSPVELGFTPVPKSLADIVSVPAGYTVTVLARLGDPLAAGVAQYANNGTDDNFAQRSGDHHDGMYFYGLAATGNAPDPNSNTRGVLAINHENITIRYLHLTGPTTTVGGVAARPVAEAIKEIECHGVSIVEVTRAGDAGAWSYVQAGALNRRITPFTPTDFSGPARGHPLMRTVFSPTGVAGRGTINNCANGFTPWGTYLTCEENWTGYFRRDASDLTARSAKQDVSLARYGRGAASAGNNGWTTATPVAAGDTRFAKFNITINPAAAADGTGDFRNEINQYGWVVEIDPYDATSTPRKRTAMGRMNHEGAWPGNFVAGRRPAWYMGCDAQNEYLYKFVSATPWAAADATAANRLAIGDKYLDTGTLYVARFDANGTGAWLPLVFGTGPVTAANVAYSFADAGDVAINSRLAADAQGATRMDRPEWTAVNPKTGEVYLTLTNNASRTGTTTDAANPRAYVDPPSTVRANRNGHIIRLRETGDTTEALAFTWDIYVFAAGSDLDGAQINVSGLTADNDFSSPDGLWFSRTQNAGGIGNPLLWVQTDDGAFTDVTNCMMLVGQPGAVGDGATRNIVNTLADGTTRTQPTIIGALPGTKLRRFLVGPKECEITGIDSTPDGRSVFVNIQHPGEDTATGFPNTFPSNWPASQTTPTAVSRPRSATIVITKNDGGVVGA